MTEVNGENQVASDALMTAAGSKSVSGSCYKGMNEGQRSILGNTGWRLLAVDKPHICCSCYGSFLPGTMMWRRDYRGKGPNAPRHIYEYACERCFGIFTPFQLTIESTKPMQESVKPAIPVTESPLGPATERPRIGDRWLALLAFLLVAFAFLAVFGEPIVRALERTNAGS